MRYGVKPGGMTDAAWTVECQNRYVARAMKQGRDKTERGSIFAQWQKRLPGITRERVAEIWRQGVPVPDKPVAPDGQS